VRAPLVAQARTLVRMDMSGLASADPGQLEASRRALDAAAARFRQLASLLVPLGDQDFALESAQSALSQWRESLRARLATAVRYLLTHLAILAALIVAVLVVSAVWRRAVFKYLQDSRRRSQFQTLRRVAVGIALAVVILFALVSQLGSLATYVGFLTAGLAVALQNVILSIVAYFFLIGRYGVRVGDRITLAGVTGRVADIGLIRLYLMELAGADLHATGRMVVLSNSVLFQPQALFKQIPGADYLWHAVSLTLAPTVDVQTAQQHLESTADGVYEHYRPAIEAQHAAVRRLVDFDTAAPRPEVRVRFAEQGWQFDVRYPVQADQAARIDQRMLKAVREALAGEPQLQLAASGEPALKATES
ncbi:MAG: mechanosensitive ion channel family protein, partial [Steroidobacteraceae bacterium]